MNPFFEQIEQLHSIASGLSTKTLKRTAPQWQPPISQLVDGLLIFLSLIVQANSITNRLPYPASRFIARFAYLSKAGRDQLVGLGRDRHIYTEFGEHFIIVSAECRRWLVQRGRRFTEFDWVSCKGDVWIVTPGAARFQHLSSGNVWIVEYVRHVLDGTDRDTAVQLFQYFHASQL